MEKLNKFMSSGAAQNEYDNSQTWPVWLMKDDFSAWYMKEIAWRTDQGLPPIPLPPPEIIEQIIKE